MHRSSLPGDTEFDARVRQDVAIPIRVPVVVALGGDKYHAIRVDDRGSEYGVAVLLRPASHSVENDDGHAEGTRADATTTHAKDHSVHRVQCPETEIRDGPSGAHPLTLARSPSPAPRRFSGHWFWDRFSGPNGSNVGWLTMSGGRFAVPWRLWIALLSPAYMLAVVLVTAAPSQGVVAPHPARASVQLAAESSRDAPMWPLVSVSFASPATGYGVFQRESENGVDCTDFVAATIDGGRRFSAPVLVTSWNCFDTEFYSALAFDDVGDGFLYGTSLFVTHDDGHQWSASAQPGPVLDVEAVGRSIWMIEATCRSGAPDAAECPSRLLDSDNGGRTWSLMRTPRFVEILGAVGTYLVRESARAAYLVARPTMNPYGRDDSAPVWFTRNGGATWSSRRIPCGMDATSVVMAAAPNGALVAVCASEGSAGYQPKSVLRSTDDGRTWTFELRCRHPWVLTCSSPLDVGYLGNVVAPSPANFFEVGGRSLLNVSVDGGASWKPVTPSIGAAGGTSQVIFFNRRQGLVLVSFPTQLWVTSDGGAIWQLRVVQRE